MEFANLTYKNIKEYIDSLNEISEEVILELSKDKRKNVKSLSESLMKRIEKEKSEIKRVKGMYEFDKNIGNYAYIAGVDEVGRGPLAGPIVSAAVILDLNCDLEQDLILGIKDSKKLSASKREELSKKIKEKAIAYNVSVIDNKEIDMRGIAWCNNETFRRACSGLRVKPDLIISDGYAVRGVEVENKFFIKGDTKSASIACASIIAKVFRDEIMHEYDKKYPQYNFKHNVGYGTSEHIDAIRKYGYTSLHRMSFLKNIIR